MAAADHLGHAVVVEPVGHDRLVHVRAETLATVGWVKDCIHGVEGAVSLQVTLDVADLGAVVVQFPGEPEGPAGQEGGLDVEAVAGCPVLGGQDVAVVVACLWGGSHGFAWGDGTDGLAEVVTAGAHLAQLSHGDPGLDQGVDVLAQTLNVQVSKTGADPFVISTEGHCNAGAQVQHGSCLKAVDLIAH